jgi:replicative superfamily II helicase
MIASFVNDQTDRERRLALIQRLRNAPAGLDKMLQRPILKGVAYHNAGLTTEERGIIEDAYDIGILKVLAVHLPTLLFLIQATATLAAGINLPSRRVIFRGPRMAMDVLSFASYRQMKGRAGRKGRLSWGELLVFQQN